MIRLGKREKDLAMGRARRVLDWNKMYELAINGKYAKEIMDIRAPGDEDVCTMWWDFCSLKIWNKYYNLKNKFLFFKLNFQ